ncbi:MAG: hypothetical protein F6K40_14195 [Okeania sp. SIO3I5]|nr:hypothetical protein [Okeania sp. SIO3I5]NEQ37354.1 hypothetical protein [Okeania sp. SIO3I5]
MLSLTSLAIRKGGLILPIISFLIRDFKKGDRLSSLVEERSLILCLDNYQ